MFTSSSLEGSSVVESPNSGIVIVVPLPHTVIVTPLPCTYHFVDHLTHMCIIQSSSHMMSKCCWIVDQYLLIVGHTPQCFYMVWHSECICWLWCLEAIVKQHNLLGDYVSTCPDLVRFYRMGYFSCFSTPAPTEAHPDTNLVFLLQLKVWIKLLLPTLYLRLHQLSLLQQMSTSNKLLQSIFLQRMKLKSLLNIIHLKLQLLQLFLAFLQVRNISPVQLLKSKLNSPRSTSLQKINLKNKWAFSIWSNLKHRKQSCQGLASSMCEINHKCHINWVKVCIKRWA